MRKVSKSLNMFKLFFEPTFRYTKQQRWRKIMKPPELYAYKFRKALIWSDKQNAVAENSARVIKDNFHKKHIGFNGPFCEAPSAAISEAQMITSSSL